MAKDKDDRLIKRYQLEHLVPLGCTIISIYFWFNYFQQNWIYFSGLIINLIGLLIWWSAKIKIGENWSAGYGKPQIKNLITTGIYSKLRHPLYWGINFTLFGIGLISLNVWISAISLLIIVYFFIRMHIETRYLEKALGKKYLLYEKKTWL